MPSKSAPETAEAPTPLSEILPETDLTSKAKGAGGPATTGGAAEHGPDEGEPQGCPACNGLHIYRQTSRGRQYCGCRGGIEAAERYMSRLHSYFEHSGIPPRLQGLSLRTFRRAAEAAAGEGADPLADKADAVEITEKLMQGETHRGRSGILLRGPNGVGKTGLLVCLARASFERGWVPLFVKYTDFVQSVQAGYGKPVNGPSGGTVNMEMADFLIRVGQTAPLLILDDIGDPFARQDRFQETEDRRRILFQLLAARHETGRPTHLSANFRTRREMAVQVGPRIADRMREMCAEVEMEGVNLRDAS